MSNTIIAGKVCEAQFLRSINNYFLFKKYLQVLNLQTFLIALAKLANCKTQN